MAATAQNRGSSGGYSPRQTGATSRFGNAAGGTTRTVRNPWGNVAPQATATGTTPQGNTRSRAVLRGSAIRRPTPDPQLWGMSYRANDPVAWPQVKLVGGVIVPDKAGPASGMTAAKATRNNAIVEHAYTRAGYQTSP